MTAAIENRIDRLPIRGMPRDDAADSPSDRSSSQRAINGMVRKPKNSTAAEEMASEGVTA